MNSKKLQMNLIACLLCLPGIIVYLKFDTFLGIVIFSIPVFSFFYWIHRSAKNEYLEQYKTWFLLNPNLNKDDFKRELDESKNFIDEMKKEWAMILIAFN